MTIFAKTSAILLGTAALAFVAFSSTPAQARSCRQISTDMRAINKTIDFYEHGRLEEMYHHAGNHEARMAAFAHNLDFLNRSHHALTLEMVRSGC